MTQLFPLKHLANYPKFFLDVIAQEYPLSVDLILKHQDLWNWKYISINQAIHWSEEALEKLEDKLVWANSRFSLSQNPALPWSVELIKKYVKKKKWAWEDLACQEKIFEDPKMIALCLPHWSEKAREKINPESWDAEWDMGTYEDFKYIKWGKEAIDWAPALVENCSNLDWDLFSGVQGFPWSLEFVQKHQDQLNWKRLSANPGMPWSMEFLETFKERLDWYWVHCSWKDIYGNYSNFHYTQEILETFEDYIDWEELSIAREHEGYEFPLQWMPEMLVRFKGKIHWSEPQPRGMGDDGMSLINEESVYWTEELFLALKSSIEDHFEKEKNRDENTMEKNEKGERVYWTYYCNTNNWSPELFELLLGKQKKESILTINWPKLLRNAKHLWSEDFILKHTPEIIAYMDDLCANEFFPWNHYLDEWANHIKNRGWQLLSQNRSLSISIELIDKYRDKWDWKYSGFTDREDLTEQIIEAFKDDWNWQGLSCNTHIPLKTLFEYPDKIDFKIISERKDLCEETLTPQILKRFEDRWDWYWLSKNPNIPLSYLYPHFERLSLSGILKREGLKIKDLDLSLPWKWENLGIWLDTKKEITRHLNDELVEEFLSQVKAENL